MEKQSADMGKKLERKVDEGLCYCMDRIGDGRGRLKGAEILIARGYPDDVILRSSSMWLVLERSRESGLSDRLP